MTSEARDALQTLGLGEAQIQRLAEGEPVAFTLSGTAEGTIAVARLLPTGRFQVGITTIMNIGGGLADFMTFEAKAQAAAQALGAKELELLGIEITNPRLRATLKMGEFRPTTITLPDELAGGTANALSRVEIVK